MSQPSHRRSRRPVPNIQELESKFTGRLNAALVLIVSPDPAVRAVAKKEIISLAEGVEGLENILGSQIGWNIAVALESAITAADMLEDAENEGS